MRIESTRGYSSHNMNPFLAVLSETCTEETGDCYGFNLLYSGSFAITAYVSHNKSVRVQGGINDYLFGWALNGGEEFVTPQAALCYSAEGLSGMSRAYHDFFREYIINPDNVNKRRPIVVNNWEATYFNFDNEKLFAIIDEAAKLDGAGKFQQIFRITIPMIVPTIVVMLIIRLGYLMEAGFEQIYTMISSTTRETGEIIGTYIYRISLGENAGNYGLSPAVGLFNGVISLILIVAANYISKKVTQEGIW